MAHHFSFKTQVVMNDICYAKPSSNGDWVIGVCLSCVASLEKDSKVSLAFGIGYGGNDFKLATLDKDHVANKYDFDEWRSRVIDTAVQQFNYKGNVENIFGPPSFNELLPMYIAGKSPITAYMASMGLLETDFDDE